MPFLTYYCESLTDSSSGGKSLRQASIYLKTIVIVAQLQLLFQGEDLYFSYNKLLMFITWQQE